MKFIHNNVYLLFYNATQYYSIILGHFFLTVYRILFKKVYLFLPRCDLCIIVIIILGCVVHNFSNW